MCFLIEFCFELALAQEPAEDDADDGWAAVLERIHRAGVNIAGYEIAFAEQQHCVEAMASGLRCGCLGPLDR